ncbi:MAG: hypothetical protein ACSHYF_00895 [Verrucomicrobiaceae bacterium]
MKKITTTKIAGFLVLQLLILQGVSGKTVADRSHVFAEKMNEILVDLKDTHYQSKTVVDPEKGVFRCNCSGLISHLLRHHFPESYLTVRGSKAPWKVRPLAVTFYETFMVAEDGRKPGWQKVNRIMDAKPGDIVAWRKLTIKEGYNTGHVVMVASQPVLDADGRVKVRIVDSSSGRRANDTRPKGVSGVGSGDMWFSIDEEGRPIAYWLNEKSNRSKSNKIAIGRIVPITVKDALFPKPVPAKAPKEVLADRDFIGMTGEDAERLAENRGLIPRVIVKEGERLAVSKTLNDERVNMVVKSGKVIRTIRG